MIAVSTTADQVRAGNYVLAGSETPRWRRVEDVEEVEFEAETYLRIWLESQMPTYYEVQPDTVVLVGRK